MITGSVNIIHPEGIHFYGMKITGKNTGSNVITDPKDLYQDFEAIRQQFPNEDVISQSLDVLNFQRQVEGCTNPSATNYNPLATVDNGTCVFPLEGCTNPLALNYNPEAEVDDGTCEVPIYGCTDPMYQEYNPFATVDLPRGEGIFGACNLPVPIPPPIYTNDPIPSDSTNYNANEIRVHNIPIHPGENYISTYLDISKLTLSDVVSGNTTWSYILQSYLYDQNRDLVRPEGNIKFVQDAEGNIFRPSNRDVIDANVGIVNTLTNWENTKAYRIVSEANETLILRLTARNAITANFEVTIGNLEIDGFKISTTGGKWWIPNPTPYSKSVRHFFSLSNTSSMVQLRDPIDDTTFLFGGYVDGELQPGYGGPLNEIKPGRGYILTQTANTNIVAPLTTTAIPDTVINRPFEREFDNDKWSIFSIPRNMEHLHGASMTTVLNQIMKINGESTENFLVGDYAGAIDQIKNTAGRNFIPDSQSDPITYDKDEGYRIRTKANANAKIQFSAPYNVGEFTINFTEGWNIIRIPHWYTRTVTQAFPYPNFADYVERIQNIAGRIYILDEANPPLGGTYQDFNLIPGHGYELKVKQAFSITYNIMYTSNYSDDNLIETANPSTSTTAETNPGVGSSGY